MRVRGRVDSQEITMFIESESTHNLLDPLVIRRENISINAAENVKVRVANGK